MEATSVETTAVPRGLRVQAEVARKGQIYSKIELTIPWYTLLKLNVDRHLFDFLEQQEVTQGFGGLDQDDVSLF